MGALLRAIPNANRAVGPSDALLVGAGRGGERWALEALYRRHNQPIAGFARRLLGGTGDLDDVLQDAWTTAFESLHRLRDPRAFSSWLAAIVVHRVRRLLRRRALLRRLGLHRPEPLEEALVPASGAPPEVVVELRRIAAALGEVRADARLALLLHRVDGHSLLETATLMGVSPSTVKRRLAEADAAVAACAEGEP